MNDLLDFTSLKDLSGIEGLTGKTYRYTPRWSYKNRYQIQTIEKLTRMMIIRLLDATCIFKLK